MKKLIWFLFVFLFVLNFSFWEEVWDLIENNYEYIQISWDDILVLKPYYSNKENKYFFLGAFDFFEIESKEKFDILKSKWKISKNSLFLSWLNWGYALLAKWDWIDISQCKELDQKSSYLFEKFEIEWSFKNDKDKIVWTRKDLKCYYSDPSQIYVAIREVAIDDFDYLYKNSENLHNFAVALKKKFWDLPEDEILKKAYKYILQKVDYNFSFIETLSQEEDFEKTPWKISSFFNEKDVVCDAYVKVFVSLLRFFDIDAERIEWKIQPLEDSVFNENNFWHSWVKVWNKYFDPTFDDTGKDDFNKYFGKTKECFVLEHKFPDGISFDNPKERINYVENNISSLSEQCPLILAKVSIKDKNMFYIMKQFLKKFDTKSLEKLFCKWFNLCFEKWIDTKEAFLKKLKNYKISINKQEFSLDDELEGFQIPEKSASLSLFKENSSLSKSKKKEVKLICDRIFEILKKKPYNERLEKFKNIKSLVNNFVKRNDVSERRKSIVKYFDELFVVEKLK